VSDILAVVIIIAFLFAAGALRRSYEKKEKEKEKGR
jgi:hypothetical protein